MGWKDWWKTKPYWLKGGIIFPLIILILWGIIAILEIANIIPRGEGGTTIWMPLMFSMPIVVLYGIFGGNLDTRITAPLFIFFTLLTILEIFLIGAFIGWIYGKIKSRSKGVK